jgi:hypothetical protein
MDANLSEVATIVIPTIPVSQTASTAVTSLYVNTTGFENVECVLHLAASAAGSTSVGLIEVVAASAAAGTGAEAVTFKDIYYTVGATTTIATGTGIASRVEQSTAGVPTAKVSYSTVAADGDKQQQYVIPIRVRHLPEGKPYVAVRFTSGSATARNGQVMFILRGSNYGLTPLKTSVFA